MKTMCANIHLLPRVMVFSLWVIFGSVAITSYINHFVKSIFFAI